MATKLKLDPEADQAIFRAMDAFCKASNSEHGLRAMLALARSEPGIPILPGELDGDPWLLNVLNGTIDLRTGTLRPHDREDRITKLADVRFDSEADCPVWIGFLQEVLPDPDLREFVRRLVGYRLTGSTQEHVLPFLFGVGANGKSTFLNTIQSLLGITYAIKAPADLLLAMRNESHPTELADLFGKRLVCCNEAEDGRRLAESLVKELTGGDKIRARRMREDFWEFSPTHKIWLAANHKPSVRGTDHGIWRRIKLIPFTVTIGPSSINSARRRSGLKRDLVRLVQPRGRTQPDDRGGSSGFVSLGDNSYAASGSPWNSAQDRSNSLRNWLIRAPLTRYLRAVFVALSPLASIAAMRRWREGNWANQSPTSIRAAAVSAGPAWRSSIRISRHSPVS
jgi:P4 family phage/plasmid primase-like protien